MHRTQISLDTWQYEKLRLIAKRKRKSMSQVIRELLDHHLPGQDGINSHRRHLKKLAGIGRDGHSRGQDHDAVLYGASPSRR